MASAGHFLNAAVYPPFNGWGTAGVSMTTSGDSTVSIIIYNDGFISNHYYSVLSLNPDLSIKWSDFVSFDGSFTQIAWDYFHSKRSRIHIVLL